MQRFVLKNLRAKERIIMHDFKFEIDTIDYLMNRVEKSNITKLKVSCEDFEVVIESNPFKNSVNTVKNINMAASVDDKSDNLEPEKELSGNVVKSPIVGTFYSTPSPGKPPFVKVGDKVNKGDVIYIIESMKLMNEVKSEFTGVVKEILVESGESVEYGQPIMTID